MANKKILIIDDEPNIVEVVKFTLEKSGYKVATAYDGEEGWEKIKLVQPDLIVCDIMMPKMDGMTLLKKLKEDPATKSIPFVMLTSKGEHEDVFAGWKSGVYNYLVKPFKSSDLLNTIKAIFAYEDKQGRK